MQTFILFVALTFPGQPPVKHHEPMPSLEVCLAEAKDILEKGMGSAHSIQAGCVVIPARAEGT